MILPQVNFKEFSIHTFISIFFSIFKKILFNSLGEPDSDEGYADEYVLEDLEVAMADFVQRIMKGNFAGKF